jgi:hypothetical protein
MKLSSTLQLSLLLAIAGGGCSSVAAVSACDGACGDAEAGSDAEIEAPAWDAAVHPNYMFVTSRRYPTDFGSIDVVDGYCNDAAHAAGLPGRYVAWLSSLNVNAKDRLAGARGWIRPDGQVFVDTVDDIAARNIVVPPFLDEYGHEVHTPIDDPVLTATDGSGASAGGACDDWKAGMEANPMLSNTTAGGLTDATGGAWTAQVDVGCGWALARFYCFGVDGDAIVVPVASAGKKAFRTTGSFQTDTGLAGADALCATEAAGAGLPGTFLALLATSEASAASRFAELDGATWVRIDGVRLNRPGESLFDPGTLVAPLNLDSSGAYGDINTTIGAVGARDLATPDTNCGDWQAGINEGTFFGNSNSSLLADWLTGTDGSTFGCATTNVICLEH